MGGARATRCSHGASRWPPLAPATITSRRTRGREDPSAEQEDGAKQEDGGEPLLVALVEGGSETPSAEAVERMTRHHRPSAVAALSLYSSCTSAGQSPTAPRRPPARRLRRRAHGADTMERRVRARAPRRGEGRLGDEICEGAGGGGGGEWICENSARVSGETNS